jgi:hypothetical protein
VDVFDADTRFQYATCKFPLFEYLRQGRAEVNKIRDFEVCAPDDSNQIKGTLQMVISNTGHTSHEKLVKYEPRAGH